METGGEPVKIVNAVFSKQNGGLEQASLDYARALKRLGHDVTMLVSDRCPFLEEVDAIGCNLRLQWNRFGHSDVLAMLQLRLWLKQVCPDVVLAHGNRAVSLLRRACAGIAPVIAVNHTTSVHRSVGMDAAIVVNDGLKTALIEHGYADANAIYVLPNMVEITQDQREREVAGMPGDPPVVGVLARFSPEKGLYTLVEALALLKQRKIAFKVRIGGDGPLFDQVMKRIMEAGLENQVELCGWIKDRDAFYDTIDVYCLPSREETFGIVVLEAMQRKIPVVATACTGVLQLVDGQEVALLPPPGDAPALAEALERMITHWRKSKQLAAAGFALVAEKYDIQIVAVQLQKIISEVVRNYALSQLEGVTHEDSGAGQARHRL